MLRHKWVLSCHIYKRVLNYLCLFEELEPEVKQHEALMKKIQKKVSDLKAGTPEKTQWVPFVQTNLPQLQTHFQTLKDNSLCCASQQKNCKERIPQGKFIVALIVPSLR